jgi:hypothetical protein
LATQDRLLETINYTNFFWFNHSLINPTKSWKHLSSAAKSIFPAIGIHLNAKGKCFPSLKRLAQLSGVSEKTAWTGVHDLDFAKFGGIEIETIINRQGYSQHRYFLPQPRGILERNTAFQFFRSVIDGGNWASIGHSARALYPAIKHFSIFNIDAMEALGSKIEYRDPENFKDLYPHREFDFCVVGFPLLADFAGISIRSLGTALKELEAAHLIEEFSYEDRYSISARYDCKGFPRPEVPIYKVFIHPPCCFV